MKKTLNLCVGKKAVSYVVAQSVATRSSKKVQLAVERHEKRIFLSQHEATSLEGYLQWPYEHEITTTENAESDWCELCKLYFLGAYLADTEFCNAIVDDMLSRLKDSSPDYASAELVWNNTPAESPLRRLFLYMWSTDAPDTVTADLKDDGDTFEGFYVDYLEFILEAHEPECPTFSITKVKHLATAIKSELERDHSKVGISANDEVEDDGEDSDW